MPLRPALPPDAALPAGAQAGEDAHGGPALRGLGLQERGRGHQLPRGRQAAEAARDHHHGTGGTGDRLFENRVFKGFSCVRGVFDVFHCVSQRFLMFWVVFH